MDDTLEWRAMGQAEEVPGTMGSRARAGRAPQDGNARRRDPERTRTALLDAALAEFAEKGLAGARVDEIAARAGVNKQMISYHFGGKEGLYQALHERWQRNDRAIDDLSRPFADVITGYLTGVYNDPSRVRFTVREALDRDPADVEFEPDASEVVNLRNRRDAGEITADLDPAFVLLLLQSVVMSGSLFPADTKRVLGLEPGTPEYLSFMSEQLRRLTRKLA